jgi:hypothetical protein
MEAQTVTAVASAILAAGSAAISVYYSHKATRHAERSAQHAYEDGMRVWAERTVDATGQLLELLSNEGGQADFDEKSGALLAVLRCQIDKGRWYFPNLHHDKKGETKPLAFRGIRQKILNVLVDLFDAVKTVDWPNRAAVFQTVESLHREFVSEVQQRLDPSTRDAAYREYVAQYQNLNSQFVQESLNRPDPLHAELHRPDPTDSAHA